MMFFTYKVNNQDDNIQPRRTLFPIWNQPVVPCPVLTVASWHAYRFPKRQIRWSGIPISFRISQFIVILTFKGFGIVNKADTDFFFLTLLLFGWSSGCWQFDLWFLYSHIVYYIPSTYFSIFLVLFFSPPIPPAHSRTFSCFGGAIQHLLNTFPEVLSLEELLSFWAHVSPREKSETHIFSLPCIQGTCMWSVRLRKIFQGRELEK